MRLAVGDRALAWLLLAGTSAFPIYRSWRFAAEWSAAHYEVAQGALLACAVPPARDAIVFDVTSTCLFGGRLRV